MCHDANVNYHNPYILVFCRHNHDIKCILSGKAEKAAMFYITDYITKTDLKTHEMLSLMSRTMATMSKHTNNDDIHNAKMLLHRCLSQFSRQQQIHGQQAARYLRGKDDTMMSHLTVPMLSNLLLSHVHATYHSNKMTDQVNAPHINEDEGEHEYEHEHEPNDLGNIRISLDKMGNLIENNQVLDYWY